MDFLIILHGHGEWLFFFLFGGGGKARKVAVVQQSIGNMQQRSVGNKILVKIRLLI